jgi:hypothetical protein
MSGLCNQAPRGLKFGERPQMSPLDKVQTVGITSIQRENLTKTRYGRYNTRRETSRTKANVHNTHKSQDQGHTECTTYIGGAHYNLSYKRFFKEVMTRDIASEEVIHVKHDDHLESTSQAPFHPNCIDL